MPEMKIEIGGRSFEVACQEGEEHYLKAAARMMDEEAQVLTAQIGRIPEPRMLLMAGLMLADRTAGMQDRLKTLEQELATAAAELERLRNAPVPAPERVEVPVVPRQVTDMLAEIAARAEALADEAAADTAHPDPTAGDDETADDVTDAGGGRPHEPPDDNSGTDAIAADATPQDDTAQPLADAPPPSGEGGSGPRA